MEELHKLFILKSNGIDLELEQKNLSKYLKNLDIYSESSKLQSPVFDDFIDSGLPGILTKIEGKLTNIQLGFRVIGRFHLIHEEIGTMLLCYNRFISSPIKSIERKEGGFLFRTLNSLYSLDLLIDD